MTKPDLSEYEAIFAAAPEPESKAADSPVPDGDYQVVVERVEIKEARSGNKYLNWGLKILGPVQKGRYLWHRNMFASASNLRFLKNDLSICGVVLERLGTLDARLKDLLDVKLEVTVKTKGEFQNIYFNRRITGSVAEAAEQGGDYPF